MVIKNIPLTSFVKFFGRNTRMKVMDFLIENRRTSWNKTEIMYHAKVGHTCLLEILKDLTNLRIIQIEKGKYFLNKKNKTTKQIISIWGEINKMRIKEVKNGFQTNKKQT